MEMIGRVGPQRLNMPLTQRLTQANRSRVLLKVRPASLSLMQTGVANVNSAQNSIASAQVNEMKLVATYLKWKYSLQCRRLTWRFAC